MGVTKLGQNKEHKYRRDLWSETVKANNRYETVRIVEAYGENVRRKAS